MKLENIKKLDIKDGNILLLSSDTTYEQATHFHKFLKENGYHDILLVYGMITENITSLDEDEMRKYGWVREKH